MLEYNRMCCNFMGMLNTFCLILVNNIPIRMTICKLIDQRNSITEVILNCYYNKLDIKIFVMCYKFYMA